MHCNLVLKQVLLTYIVRTGQSQSVEHRNEDHRSDRYGDKETPDDHPVLDAVGEDLGRDT